MVNMGERRHKRTQNDENTAQSVRSPTSPPYQETRGTMPVYRVGRQSKGTRERRIKGRTSNKGKTGNRSKNGKLDAALMRGVVKAVGGHTTQTSGAVATRCKWGCVLNRVKQSKKKKKWTSRTKAGKLAAGKESWKIGKEKIKGVMKRRAAVRNSQWVALLSASWDFFLGNPREGRKH